MKEKELFIRRIEHICVPDEPDVQGWVIHGGRRRAQYTESQNPSPKSARELSQFVVEKVNGGGQRTVPERVPGTKPNAPLHPEPQQGAEMCWQYQNSLDFELKFSEGPQ
jgi:hypothetical protein